MTTRAPLSDDDQKATNILPFSTRYLQLISLDEFAISNHARKKQVPRSMCWSPDTHICTHQRLIRGRVDRFKLVAPCRDGLL